MSQYTNLELRISQLADAMEAMGERLDLLERQIRNLRGPSGLSIRNWTQEKKNLLTPRQVMIVESIVLTSQRGKGSHHEISQQLKISERTVQTQVRNICRKLQDNLPEEEAPKNKRGILVWALS